MGLDGLADRSSREAVLAAYHRFLALLESLGHTRPAMATPYEILDGLPPDLNVFEAPARTLTDLYVLAAYAAEPVETGARDRAITALKEMRELARSAPTPPGSPAPPSTPCAPGHTSTGSWPAR